mgnify:CR=1 FL=1
MNPKGPGAKTLTLPIVAAVALLIWLWVGKDAACARASDVDLASDNGFQRLPYDAATLPPELVIGAPPEFGDDVPYNNRPDWRPPKNRGKGFGADPNFHPQPYVPPPLEELIPPPGHTVHTGIITDALTRLPISGAHFHIVTSEGRYGTSTNANGEFAVVSSIGNFGIEIEAQGYFRASYDASGSNHGLIILQPVPNEVFLNVWDARGRKLPACTITLIDSKGEAIRALSPTGIGYGSHRFEIPVIDGKVTFADLRPGSHLASLRFKSYPPVRANFFVPQVVEKELYLQIKQTILEFTYGEQENTEPEEGDAK